MLIKRNYKSIITGVILVLLTIASSSTFAESSLLNNFRSLQKNNNTLAMVYLKGVADGIVATSVYQKITPFCLPPDMPLGPDVLLGLLNDHLNNTESSVKPDDSVGFLATRAVKEAFPCK